MKKSEGKVVVAGVDVASAELVVRISSGSQVLRFSNDSKGIAELVRQVKQAKVSLVICEHTGRHEWNMVQALWKQAIAVHCAHPRSVRNFAKVLNENAKSDPVDSTVLMEYGIRMDPAPTPPPPQEIVALKEFTARRADLNQMLVQEKNRLSSPAISCRLKAGIKRHIQQLQNAIRNLERDMKQLVQQHASLQIPIARLDEEHGVGLVSAAALFASIPELGTLNRQTAGALAGLAPFVRNSGKFVGQSKISGGRTLARNALYMVALSVIRKRRHPMHKLFVRLKKNGKKTLVALTAVMRKLIIHFNTVLKELRAQEKIVAIPA
jgi:transposase